MYCQPNPEGRYVATLLHPPPEAAENNYAGPLGVVEWLHKYLQGKRREG
jgi:hypothetical protein